MPRYLFHVIGDGERYTDDEGIELPDLSTAKQEARKDANDFVRARFEMLGRDWSSWWIEICGTDGRLLATVPFGRLN